MGMYITILCFLPFPFRSASLRRQFFDLLRLLRKIKPATYLSLVQGTGERGKNVTAVFLDFRKAFDRVCHPGLLYQLSTLGVSEWSVKCLTSYLSERQISVRVGSTMSEYKTISWGVPQGSHLGPVLFIVFINNLPSTVSTSTEIYADDTTLHHEHSKLSSCSTYPDLQEAIDCTEEWAASLHGKFGHAKTRILSNNKDIMLEALTPTMEGHAVTVTDNHRHLGVVLSEDLKWSKHAQCILAAASQRAGLLRLMAREPPLPVASIHYVYYVRPFFFFYKSRLQSHEGEFWSVLVVGLPALSRLVVSASLHKQCTKRNRRFTDEGRGETKETEERRRTEEVGGLEICGSAESD